jgi:hypothetical protein
MAAMGLPVTLWPDPKREPLALEGAGKVTTGTLVPVAGVAEGK